MKQLFSKKEKNLQYETMVNILIVQIPFVRLERSGEESVFQRSPNIHS